MTRRMWLGLAAAAVLVVAGCEQEGPAQLEELSVVQLDELLAKAKPTVYDANAKETREKYGVIPGAKLLDSASDYDVGLLPEGKADPVVFYCSSTFCSAAKTAAKRAIASGHSHVNVLPVGIKGWKEAGKPTQKI